jgi:hypothetical protein
LLIRINNAFGSYVIKRSGVGVIYDEASAVYVYEIMN